MPDQVQLSEPELQARARANAEIDAIASEANVLPDIVRRVLDAVGSSAPAGGVYCVVCQMTHPKPVAVAINDRCPARPDEETELERVAAQWRGERACAAAMHDELMAAEAERDELRAERDRLRDTVALLRGWVPMGTEGWDLINEALRPRASFDAAVTEREGTDG